LIGGCIDSRTRVEERRCSLPGRACHGTAKGDVRFGNARLVLVNVPEPQQIVAELAALVKPGGWVAFHEADWIAHLCDPPSEAWSTLVDLFVAYSEKNGIDPFVGRKLPRLLRGAGVEDVHVNPLVHVYPRGMVDVASSWISPRT
jgi:hypothetical protein